MLKIGDAAKNLIFPDENTMRIRRIVLLRKLEMPISSIEDIFIKNDFDMAVNALSDHFHDLRKQGNIYESLAMLVEKLILPIKSERNIEQIFDYPETHLSNIFYEHEKALQNSLSERNSIMKTNQLNNVRIVKLPPMPVASCQAESATSEKDCSLVFNKFVLENNLHKRSDFRFFGFNNPCPSDGNPVYGYEMWVTIPDDFIVTAPSQKNISAVVYMLPFPHT